MNSVVNVVCEPNITEYISLFISLLSLIAIYCISRSQDRQTNKLIEISNRFANATSMDFLMSQAYNDITAENIQKLLNDELEMIALNNPEGEDRLRCLFYETIISGFTKAGSLTDRLIIAVGRYQKAIGVLMLINMEPKFIIDMQSTNIKRIYNIITLNFNKKTIEYLRINYTHPLFQNVNNFLTFMKAFKANKDYWDNFIKLVDQTRSIYPDQV